MEDEEIIRNIRKGKDQYMEILIQKHYPDILRYCKFQIPDKEIAEDITQDTFLQFVKNFKDYTHRGKCRSYLFSIAHNLCVDFYRKQKRRFIEQGEDSMDKYSKDLSNVEISTDLCFYLKKLEVLDQEILLLRFYYGFTFKEEARILSMPQASVKYHSKQSLLRLQRMMKLEENDNEDKRSISILG